MFTQRKQVYIFCDGSTGALERWNSGRAAPVGENGADRPRPGNRCAAAAVARSEDGSVLAIDWQVLPDVTNNEAEYAGLLIGIQLARQLRAHATVFVLDSATVVCQMTGRCGVNSPGLKIWHTRACMAVRGLPRVRYQTVPREYNRLADGAAGQAAIAWDELMRAVNGQKELD
jgi:ribonuclease HI